MRSEEIKSAYRSLGKEATAYDGMITCSTLFGKLICSLVWGMDKKKNDRYLELALEGVPQDFHGKMLEVPVGTGVLTIPVYKNLPDAEITCLDYSTDMMQTARHRAELAGLGNIHFLQGDVGCLPFGDASFDLVLSLNGFHAFPSKEAAYREVLRVLRPGGVFCGCFYVEGQQKRTDRMIRKFYVPRGFFTPPFETAASLEKRLKQTYEEVTLNTVGSMACFRCVKKAAEQKTAPSESAAV